jgi:hypothetical protein
MVQVENLKRHVASCGFSPVQCSNDGCNVLVNASDKLHHETEVCDFRNLKCHDCGQLKNEVKEMKDSMLAGQDQIKSEMKGMIENGMKEGMKEMKEGMKEMKDEMLARQDQLKSEMKGMIENEMNGMKVMIDQVVVCQYQMQSKIVKNEVREMKVEIKNEMKGMIENEMKGMKEEIKNEMKGMKEEMENEMKGMKEEMKNEMKGMKEEMKGMKEEMKGEMKEIVMNAVRDAMAGIKDLEVEMKNSNQSSQATCSLDARENIFVVGGAHKQGGRRVKNKSTECFNWADQTWTLLDSAVLEGRTYSCSFLHQGQMVVAGGYDNDNNRTNKTNTMKCLNIADPAATWKDFTVNLPVKCSCHKVVSHNDQLFISGGYVQPSAGGQSKLSDAVYEVQLVPPYSSKILTRLPQSRSDHGMEMFDQKLFILGGCHGRTTASVVQYDLIKNECKEMPPLPYAVKEMATVLWRNNMLVIGGCDHCYQCLNKVAMYNVITGRSEMLPCMKHKRRGCSAVLTGNVVVVMGGRNENFEDLKSVECFDLERQVWQDLPDMLKPRAFATALVKPNH